MPGHRRLGAPRLQPELRGAVRAVPRQRGAVRPRLAGRRRAHRRPTTRRLGRSLYLSIALGLPARRGARQPDRPAAASATSSTSSTSGSATSGGTRSTSPTRPSARPIVMLIGAALFPALSPARRATRRMVDPSYAPGVRVLRVPDGPTGRVDRYVADATGMSRSYVQKLISDGRLTVGRRGAPREHDRRRPARSCGSTSRSRSPSISQPAPDIAAAGRLRGRRPADHRQAGRARRPPGARPCRAARWSTRSWRTAAATTWGGIAGVQRPGIVHRLDRDTSGLLMVARHRRRAGVGHGPAQGAAASRRRTWRSSRAAWRPPSAGSRRRSGATRSTGRRWRSSPTAARRSTGYRVRERFADWTLLELDLVTGRTHQIRVHLDAIGHPVAGDPVYGTGTSRRGPDGLGRLFLHAWRLELDLAVRRPPHPRDGAPAARARDASSTGLAASDRPVSRRDRRAHRPSDLHRSAHHGRDARHHLGPERRREGHHHRRAAAPTARPRVPLRRDLHDAGAAARRGRRRRLPLPRRRRRSPRSARAASSSRRTRSTRTGTARRASEVRDALAGRPRRDPQDRRPGRPGRQGEGPRRAAHLHRPAVARGPVPAPAQPRDGDRRRARAPPAQRRHRAGAPGGLRLRRDQRDRPGRADRRADRRDHRRGASRASRTAGSRSTRGHLDARRRDAARRVARARRGRRWAAGRRRRRRAGTARQAACGRGRDRRGRAGRRPDVHLPRPARAGGPRPRRGRARRVRAAPGPRRHPRRGDGGARRSRPSRSSTGSGRTARSCRS